MQAKVKRNIVTALSYIASSLTMVSFVWSIRHFYTAFWRAKYGKRLSSGGTDSQTFAVDN